MQTFFSFPDRSLKYDCPSCGSHCCKGKGLALEASEEVTRFARLEPRLASLLYPMNAKLAAVTDMTDGCWFLQPNGMCGVELERGYEFKPHTCRLFPFNRIFTVGDVRVIDFNSRICPLQDASTARDGQSWEALMAQADADPLSTRGTAQVPRGGAELDWAAQEMALRDLIDEHLDDSDYANFAALQEEWAMCLLKKQPLPKSSDDRVQRRTDYLRKLLGRWRAHHGILESPELTAATKLATRHAVLLTCSWRLSVILHSDADPYPSEIQLLPKRLLATTQMLEMSHLARRSTAGLRHATELWQNAAPLGGLLAFWQRKVKLGAPPKLKTSKEAMPALEALAAALTAPTKMFGETVEEALAPFEPVLRSLAFSALAFGDAELMVE